MGAAFCVSEHEAETKVCPIVQAPGARCAASKCMAWRWVETHIQDAEGNFTILSGDTHGYCGMAGPPWRRS